MDNYDFMPPDNFKLCDFDTANRLRSLGLTIYGIASRINSFTINFADGSCLVCPTVGDDYYCGPGLFLDMAGSFPLYFDIEELKNE